MKAVIVYGPNDLRVEEVPNPLPTPGEVIVAVEWGGICGSDIAYWKSGSSGTATLASPMVLGHEFAGRVIEATPGADQQFVGRAVTVHPAEIVEPSQLPSRLQGRSNLHPAVRYFGSAAFHPHTQGGFSERVKVKVGQLRILPDTVDTKCGALAEPLGVAMHAVKRFGDVAGRDVMVNGAGPIGCLVIASLKHAGARSIIAIDVSDDALSRAKEMGATQARNVAHGDSMPEDVEIVFEASGAPSSLGGVLHATARGGTVVQVGNLPGSEAPASLGDLVTREITWIGSYRFVDEISAAIEAMAAGLDVTPVMTHTFDADEAVLAIRTAADRSTGSSKVMLRFG